MKGQLIQAIQKAVKDLVNEEVEVNVELTRPSDPTHGDYTTNVAMQIFSRVKGEALRVKYKSPLNIAQELASRLTLDPLPYIDRVEAVAPGFINFYLSSDFLISHLEKVINSPEKIDTSPIMQDKRVIIEFTDPNPFKALHIGHVYTNTIGESLSRLNEAVGATVQRADYYGDVGMHIGKALFGLKKMLAEDNITFQDLSQKSLNERIQYFGKAYALGSTVYEEDVMAAEEIKKLNRLAYIAAQKMWEEKGIKPQVDYQKEHHVDEKELEEVYEMYVTGRKWSLEYFNTIYQRLGMQFSGDYPESLAAEKGYKLVKEHISDGTFREDNGAVIFKGEDHGLHTRVFINSLGLPTYEAKELGLAVWKNEEFPYDYSIILTGNEINEYFKVLIKALSIIRPELSAKTRHVGHGMVKLSSGKKMSSRTGQIIAGEEVLDEAKRLAKEKIAQAKLGKNVASEEADQIAEMVGVGAVKYAFLKANIGRDIPFSFEESVSFEGNAGPYLQYTFVRTQSIMHKFQISNSRLASKRVKFQIDAKSRYDPNSEEALLLRQIVEFGEVVEQAAKELSPSAICTYLYQLCQNFNNFYQKYRIVNAPAEEEKQFRLALTAGVGVVLKQGLGLLGIAAPDRM